MLQDPIRETDLKKIALEINKNGVESMRDYHAKGRSEKIVSSHKLIDFLKNQVLFSINENGPEREETASMAIGSAVHKFVLEGRLAFDAEYMVGGLINPKTGKAYGLDSDKQREYMAQMGKKIVSEELYADILDMAKNIKAHKLASLLLTDHIAEGVIRGEINGVKCQVRPDALNIYGMTDLKTCDDLDFFEYDIKNYRYDLGSSFYNYVIGEATGILIPTYIVAVEKIKSHRVGVWEVSETTLAKHRFIIDLILEEMQTARETGIYKTNFEEIKSL
jgi:hypothetical protein